MCVILIAESKRPTEDMVTKCFDTNPAGAGAAWRDSGFVKWEKGFEIDRAQELAATLPMPFILHFRIPTEGGKRQQLCHPFPIKKDVSLELVGATKGFVLFHNGHWNDWKPASWRILEKFPDAKLPDGKWSDTRAMAWAAAWYGNGVLELIGEKAVVFGPKQGDLETAGIGWYEIENNKGLWASNRVWESRSRSWQGPGYLDNLKPYCAHHACTSKELIGVTGRCRVHQTNPIVLPGTTAGETNPDTEEDTGTDSTAADLDDNVIDITMLQRTDRLKRINKSRGGEKAVSPFDRRFAIALKDRKAGLISKHEFKSQRKTYEAYLERIGPLSLRGTPMLTTEELVTLH